MPRGSAPFLLTVPDVFPGNGEPPPEFVVDLVHDIAPDEVEELRTVLQRGRNGPEVDRQRLESRAGSVERPRDLVGEFPVAGRSAPVELGEALPDELLRVRDVLGQRRDEHVTGVLEHGKQRTPGEHRDPAAPVAPMRGGPQPPQRTLVPVAHVPFVHAGYDVGATFRRPRER